MQFLKLASIDKVKYIMRRIAPGAIQNPIINEILSDEISNLPDGTNFLLIGRDVWLTAELKLEI